ncbi:MAG: hypothetical protein ABR587_00425 [Candidatus Binatia bacterium]
MNKWGWILAVVAMTAGVSEAQWTKNDGEAVAKETWHQTDGDFGAMLIVTDRYKDFVQTWSHPTKDGSGPAITMADAAARGDEVAAVLTFARCSPGIVGKCQCDADFIVLRPDGSTYSTHRKVPVWNSAPPADENAQLALGRLRFRVEADDPLGTYQIRAVVRDLVAKRQVTLEWAITVKPESWAPGQAMDLLLPAGFEIVPEFDDKSPNI